MTVEGFDLSGKRALVVGAESTVGQSIAVALAQAAAKVGMALLGAPNPDDLKRLNDLDNAVPPGAELRSVWTGGDPLLRADVDAIVGSAVGHLGGLDVVVNCADLRMAGPFEELTDDDWDRLVAVNLSAPVRLLRAAGREMLARGGGRIIQVVSLLGERGVPNTAAYGACQAGLIQLIQALALEWARRNVRVNGIGFGWFEGDPLLSHHPGEGFLRYLPMRRLGRPEEVGALAVYLASDAADMMTGQTIWVDGAILSHA